MFVEHSREGIVAPSLGAVNGGARGVVGDDENGIRAALSLDSRKPLRDELTRLRVAAVHTRRIRGRAYEIHAVHYVMSERFLPEFSLEEPPGRGMKVVVVIAHYRLNDGFIARKRSVKAAFEQLITVF